MQAKSDTRCIQEEQTWRKNYSREVVERRKEFLSDSGLPVKNIYTPLDLEEINLDYLRDLGFPGQYPFTRGREPLMYRGRFWLRSQFSGFGDARVQGNTRVFGDAWVYGDAYIYGETRILSGHHFGSQNNTTQSISNNFHKLVSEFSKSLKIR